MKLKEAKAYALETLKLERDFVRTFGKLTATQTWLDAIAAAETVAEPLDMSEAAISITTPEEAIAIMMPGKALAITTEEALAPSVAEEMTVVAEPAEVPDVSVEVLESASASIQLPGKVSEDSFITFWESAPDPVHLQPLECLPELDAAWETSEPTTTAPVVVYPIVILLMMLWALVQMLLLGGKALCWMLATAGQQLDDLAQARLEHCRESTSEPTSGKLAFAISSS